MKKEEILQLMLESINEDNRQICKRGMMPDDQIEKMIKESEPSLMVIVESLYNKMRQNNLLV